MRVLLTPNALWQGPYWKCKGRFLERLSCPQEHSPTEMFHLAVFHCAKLVDHGPTLMTRAGPSVTTAYEVVFSMNLSGIPQLYNAPFDIKHIQNIQTRFRYTWAISYAWSNNFSGLERVFPQRSDFVLDGVDVVNACSSKCAQLRQKLYEAVRCCAAQLGESVSVAVFGTVAGQGANDSVS